MCYECRSRIHSGLVAVFSVISDVQEADVSYGSKLKRRGTNGAFPKDPKRFGCSQRTKPFIGRKILSESHQVGYVYLVCNEPLRQTWPSVLVDAGLQISSDNRSFEERCQSLPDLRFTKSSRDSGEISTYRALWCEDKGAKVRVSGVLDSSIGQYTLSVTCRSRLLPFRNRHAELAQRIVEVLRIHGAFEFDPSEDHGKKNEGDASH